MHPYTTQLALGLPEEGLADVLRVRYALSNSSLKWYWYWYWSLIGHSGIIGTVGTLVLCMGRVQASMLAFTSAGRAINSGRGSHNSGLGIAWGVLGR